MPAKKKKKASKKKKTKSSDLWCKQDIDFDKNGCLYIKNEYLAAAVQQAIYDPNHKFCITMKDPGSQDKTINAMCPC